MRDHLKKLLLLAWPVSLGQLMHIVANISDTVMLGWYDAEVSLPAASFAFNVYMPLLLLGIGYTMGLTPLVSMAEGAKDRGEQERLIRHSFRLFTVVGFGMSLLLFLATPLLGFMGQDKAVVRPSQDYFEILVWSIFPVMVSQVFKQFAEGKATTTPALVINVVANALNIFLNYLLIYGNWGFPELGIKGAAYATTISRVVMALLFVLYFFWDKRFVTFLKPMISGLFEGKVFKKIHSLSYPIGLQLLLEAGAFGFTAIMIGWFGKENLAGHEVALRIASVCYILMTGVGAASTVRVGYYYGSNDIPNLQKAARAGIWFTMGFMLLTLSGLILGRHWLPSLMVEHDATDVINIASNLLILAAIFQFPDGLQVTFMGILRGLKETKVPTMIALFSYWIVGLPIGWVLAKYVGLGVPGIWWGLVIGLSCSASLLALRYRFRLRQVLG